MISPLGLQDIIKKKALISNMLSNDKQAPSEMHLHHVFIFSLYLLIAMANLACLNEDLEFGSGMICV